MREEFEKEYRKRSSDRLPEDVEQSLLIGSDGEYVFGLTWTALYWWQAATALQAERVRGLEEALAELQRKYDAENEPDCYSEDGDYWFDCPNDIELVEGKKVGDRFCLLGGFHALPIQFTVTKAPDDESDDYEVEQALSATARENK